MLNFQRKPLMGLMEVMPRLWEMRLAALLCRYLNVANGSLEHGCEGFRIQFLTELVLVGWRDFEDPDLSWDETSIGINKSRCRRKLGLLAQRVGLCGSDLSVTTIRAWHAVFERHERSLVLTGRCGKPSFCTIHVFPRAFRSLCKTSSSAAKSFNFEAQPLHLWFATRRELTLVCSLYLSSTVCDLPKIYRQTSQMKHY